MVIRTFRTFVGNKVTYKNGNTRDVNDYIRGRISGISYVICERPNGVTYPVMRSTKTNMEIFRVKCTPEQYGQFKKMIEEFYPGLCKFDV